MRHGSRAQGVVTFVSRITSLYSNPETKTRCCAVPMPAIALAFVNAFELITRSGWVVGCGRGRPAAGVLGCGSVTGDVAWAIASAPFQFSSVYVGVILTRLPSCKRAANEPPTALESGPPATSLN